MLIEWLLARILGWRSRSEEPIDARASAESKWPGGTRPRLAFLIRDAAGPASYRLQTFEDAAAAAAFVQFWFPPGHERGTLAFWATHEEPVQRPDPIEMRPAEVVVLIRDETRPQVVYPFSFPDMGLAQAWLAREAARGLGLRCALVYWAMPARISRDQWGRAQITPTEPPALLLRERPHSTPGAATGSGRDTTEGNKIADVLEEAERVVQDKRSRPEGPFQGFGSPPGKF